MRSEAGATWIGVSVACAACGLGALAFGPDANWDLRNYHLYVAWAWLEDRATTDLAAAQAQSWFNPLLWIPHSVAVQHLGGATLAAGIGALQGLCAAPLLALAIRLAPDRPLASRMLAVAGGLTAATFLGQLGASYGDAVLAGIALCGVLLAHDAAARERVDVRRALAAGALLGAVAALKLSHAPVALGLCAGLPLLAADRRAALRLTGWCAAGALAAFVLLAGPWAWTLWRDWGNPVFPQFDALFGDDWIARGAARDLRFVPASAAEALARPLAPLFDWRATSDYRIRDARMLLLVVAIGVLAWRWRAIAPGPRRLLAALSTGFAVAYLLWLPLFGYHRYLVALELAAPLMLLAASGGHRLALAAIVLCVLSTNPPNHERASGDWPAAAPVQLSLAPGTLVVMTGNRPTSFVLPFARGMASAVRIESNLWDASRPAPGLQRQAAARLAAHDGPMVVLLQDDDPAQADPALAAYRLARVPDRCAQVATPMLPAGEPPLWLCQLARR